MLYAKGKPWGAKKIVGLPIEYDRSKVASMIRARLAYISQITNLNEIFSLTLNFDLKGDL